MSKNQDQEAFSEMVETFKRMLDRADEAYGREDVEHAALLLNEVTEACAVAIDTLTVRGFLEMFLKKLEAQEKARRN